MGASEGRSRNSSFIPDWPATLPNKWKIDGITGIIAIDKDDNVWAYDRPNDLTEYVELEAEPESSHCRLLRKLSSVAHSLR